METVLRAIGWRRALITALCLLVWRFIYQVPIVGIDLQRLGAIISSEERSGSVLAALGSSEPFAQYSVGALGVGPYINAIVIMTLAGLLSPTVRDMRWSWEGIQRRRVWTRVLAVGLAAWQAYRQVGLLQGSGLLPDKIPWFSTLLIAAELTAGTTVLIAVADVIDEHGLGFGLGPIWIYALGPVVVETHRLAAVIGNAPSVEALYPPALVWIVASISIVALTVAGVGAYRTISSSRDERKRGAEPSYALVLLTAGVLRPPLVAFTIVNLPNNVADSIQGSNPGVAAFIHSSWSPSGSSALWSTGYVGAEALIVVLLVYLFTIADVQYQLPPSALPHLWRLTLLGGLLLVVTVVVIPHAEMLGSSLAGHELPMSGFDAVLITAILVPVIGRLRQIAHPEMVTVPVRSIP